MALADFYQPFPPVACPVCGSTIDEWEGYGGVGAWVVYREGEPEPVEMRRAQVSSATLSDGTFSLFGECHGVRVLAHITVVDGVWNGLELIDIDGGEPMPLVGDFKLWRVPSGRYCIASTRPAIGSIIPASITAVGFNDSCIVATRRAHTRDPRAVDEWYVIDVNEEKSYGPLDDHGTVDKLASLGLVEPEIMRIPEEYEQTRG
ncbi:MAG: hypothetical protein AAGF12_03600 [Myxococcota bacterium]